MQFQNLPSMVRILNWSMVQLSLQQLLHAQIHQTRASCWLQPYYVKMQLKEVSKSLLTLRLHFRQVHRLYPNIMKSVAWLSTWTRWDSTTLVMDAWLALETQDKSIRKLMKPSRLQIFALHLSYQETETSKAEFIQQLRLTFWPHRLLSLPSLLPVP